MKRTCRLCRCAPQVLRRLLVEIDWLEPRGESNNEGVLDLLHLCPLACPQRVGSERLLLEPLHPPFAWTIRNHADGPNSLMTIVCEGSSKKCRPSLKSSIVLFSSVFGVYLVVIQGIQQWALRGKFRGLDFLHEEKISAVSDHADPAGMSAAPNAQQACRSWGNGLGHFADVESEGPSGHTEQAEMRGPVAAQRVRPAPCARH